MQFSSPIQAGSPADQVKAIQAPLGVQQTGIYGDTTRENVQLFQRVHQLPQTGIVDAATFKAIMAQGTSKGASIGTNERALRDAVLRIALKEEGVLEQPLGTNRGPRVNEYNRAAGTAIGSHWCLSFVFWACQQAALALKVGNPIPKSAYCPYIHNWAIQHKKITTNPQPGDIFLVKQLIKGQWWAVHTGFVVGPDPKDPDRVLTVEGNTNTDGSSNGIGVFRRSRRKDSCWFVRLV